MIATMKTNLIGTKNFHRLREVSKRWYDVEDKILRNVFAYQPTFKAINDLFGYALQQINPNIRLCSTTSTCIEYQLSISSGNLYLKITDAEKIWKTLKNEQLFFQIDLNDFEVTSNMFSDSEKVLKTVYERVENTFKYVANNAEELSKSLEKDVEAMQQYILQYEFEGKDFKKEFLRIQPKLSYWLDFKESEKEYWGPFNDTLL